MQDKDFRAIALLVLLWLLFFWRLFTPIAADQASLAKGDFSGQFVAFAGYQYERMSRGEIPLWNPYNNGGLPFIADTQAAVFYPPRWLTIGLSSISGGWSYNALQLEMAFHVLLYTLLMYLFVRRLTWRHALSHLAAFCSAVIIGYGGYTTGYPPLQLAVLEAAVWFPLIAIGILEASRGRRLAFPGIALAGFGLGLSWLAGHPQTSWFITYVVVAYLLFRSLRLNNRWRSFIAGFVALATVTIGVCAVTLLPGIEYLLLTSREELGYAAKGNGFPFRDIVQLVFPGSVSQWSPLYAGIPALFFVALAATRGERESRFWLLTAFIGLLHSLGDNSAFYQVTYNFVPGLRFFRGQERAAVVVANSLAILAGLGIVAAAAWTNHLYRRRAIHYWGAFASLVTGVALVAFFAWTADSATWGGLFNIATRSAFIAVAAFFVLRSFVSQPRRIVVQLALAALIVFELFSVNLDHPAIYDSLPYNEQLSMTPSPLVQQVLDDDSRQPFRVDGFRGLEDNYGSLHGLMDVRGISPLWLKAPLLIIYADYDDNPLSWELYAVKYVFSGQERLSVPTQVIGRGADQRGAVYLHRLDDPRPFARLYYEADVVDNEQWAVELMGDIRYDEREKIVLQRAPALALPGQAAAGKATVASFAPEEIVVHIDTADNAILSLSLPHYPGWKASLNGEPVPIIPAYAGLSAVEIPAGQHSLSLTFAPDTYAVGVIVSGLTWLALALYGLLALLRRS
ncbi:MAG: YfhO family protein [Chloroflexi bacterium]|nr:YfhO family protein [Chloroflexota bacterium]